MAHAAAFLAYVALTLALTWPLAIALATLVPYDLGDPLLSTWALWWNAHATPFTDRWWDGPVFFPARRTLTLSDHRVGLSFIATPLIWAGASPLAAQNVAYLSTFVLSAVSAYALCFALTRNYWAAFLGGLVFGFNPFRADHLPHLELLASYWLPLILLVLHQWVRSARVQWLVLLSVALTFQAITSGYYFVFSGALIGLWLLWFMPRRATPSFYVATLAALAVPLLVVAPVLRTYSAAHREMGLSRSIHDIETLSADILGLVTAPELLAFWNTPASWYGPEGALFPGATALLLVVVALVWRPSRLAAEDRPRWWRTSRRGLLAVSILMVAIALIPAIFGPIAFNALGVRVSVSAAYKPLSLAAVFFTVWLLTTYRVRDAWRRQSPFAFYVLATIAMWAFALGPTARFAGHRVLYKAPYSWLMLVPGIRDEFRSPARFALLAVLTLSVATALAFCRLFKTVTPVQRVAAAAALSAAVVLDSWIEPFPVEPPPAELEIPATVPSDAVVAELPIGIYEDARAMYRSMSHGRPIVNGMSGYDPPHQTVLREALNDGQFDALRAVAVRDVAIFVQRGGQSADIVSRLRSQTNVQPLGSTTTHDVFLLPQSERILAPTADLRRALKIEALSASVHPELLPHVLDDERVTVWSTDKPQSGDETVTADLGREASVSAVVLTTGGYGTAFPRAVAIALSVDGQAWQEVWRGTTGARVVATALASPRDVPLVLDFAPQSARYVRISQQGRSKEPWAITKLTIVGQEAVRQPPAPPSSTR